MKISFWKHHPIADQNGRQLASRTIDFQHQFEFDYIKLTPAGSWLAVCYGLEDVWGGDALGRREIRSPLITQPQHWATLADFRVVMPAMLDQQLLAAHLTWSAFPTQPVYATVFSPVSQAIQLAGLDQFLRHAQDFPEQLAVGLRKLTENLCFVLEEFSRQAIQGLYYVIQHARLGGLTPAQYHLVNAWDQRCLSEATRLFSDVLVHLHGQAVYNPIATPLPSLRFHFAADPPTLPINMPLYQPGLPTNLLATCSQLPTALQALADYYPAGSTTHIPHLMSECVLPLAFPDSQIHFWKQAVRS